MTQDSLAYLRKELQLLDNEELQEVCMRLARHKLENKELLYYLLVGSRDEDAYIAKAKADIEEAFDAMNVTSAYYANKSMRKALRIADKFIKYSKNPITEVELLMCYMQKLKHSGVQIRKSNVLAKLRIRVLTRIERAMEKLHEDLQFDYSERLKLL
jgi:hypothetical protein